MKNPWRTLPDSQPYVLESDRTAVMAHNARTPEVIQIKQNVLPEPYLGRPDAPIVLLNLNPGYADEDVPFYQQPIARELWRKNLLHLEMDYPFWLLNPALDQNVGGTRWWRQKLRELIDSVGLERAATNIICVEFFPYHSRRFSPLPETLESQEYSFYLVRQAMRNRAAVVMMRGERRWLDAIPELSDYQPLFRLHSTQNVAVSRRNCPDGFPVIERLLQG